MAKSKKYNYKGIHLKDELKQKLDIMRREYGFVSYSELIIYLIDREVSLEPRKKNCNMCNVRD